jgi:hypothetical protein
MRGAILPIVVVLALVFGDSARAANPWTPYSQYGPYLHLVNCCGPVANWPNQTLDANGIPMETRDGGASYHYNPVTIALFGLQAYSWYLKYGALQYQQNAIKAADWFVSHQDAQGEWRYDFDFVVGGFGIKLSSGWGSAMAQGQAISLLVRVAHLTGSDVYIVTARAALPSLNKTYSQGGVRADFFGQPWYEEYPTSPPSFTLNGFMFTLVGLYDLNSVDPTAGAGPLFSQGINSLVFALPFYDLNTTSSYHLGHVTRPPRVITTIESYHRIHVMLLRVLGAAAPNSIISFYANRWATYPPCAGYAICAP